jgi:hypothetical protein
VVRVLLLSFILLYVIWINVASLSVLWFSAV